MASTLKNIGKRLTDLFTTVQRFNQHPLTTVQQGIQNVGQYHPQITRQIIRTQPLFDRYGSTPLSYKEGYTDFASLGLIDQPNRIQNKTTADKVGYGAGAAAGLFLNPIGKLGAFSKLDTVGKAAINPLVTKFVPKATSKTAQFLIKKAVPAVGAELAQTIGYSGAQVAANKAGLTKRELTPKSFAENLGIGLGMRGALSTVVRPTIKTQVKTPVFHPEDVNVLDRSVDILRTKKGDINQARKSLYNLAENYLSPQERPDNVNITQIVKALQKKSSQIDAPYMKIPGMGFAPKGQFGSIYTRFKNKPTEAINHLLEVQKGEAKGALYRKDIGDIDLVWGKSGPNGYGVAHILESHGENTVRNIPNIIKNGVVKKIGDRLHIDTPDNRASVRLDWNGKEKKWVVTAFNFDKKNPGLRISPTSKSSPTTGFNSPVDKNSVPSVDDFLNGKINDIGKQNVTFNKPEAVGDILRNRGTGSYTNLSSIDNPILSGKMGGENGKGPVMPDPNYKPVNLSDVEEMIYGTKTGIDAKGTKTSVGVIGDNLRRVENTISSKVAQGLRSPNTIIRGMANLTQDLIGGAGKSQNQINARQNYRGGVDYATKIAEDGQKHIYTLLNKDTASLERVHAVLDPDISKIKVSEKQLTAQEQEAVATLRQMSDFINDTNFSLGFISHDKWASNTGGKYIARAYEAYDYPPEVADFVSNKGLRFDLNPFEQRKEITDWKIEESIKDPAYLMGKRMQQTLFNSEVRKYTNWLRDSKNVSNVERPGFIQLSDSQAYGDLKGKWIPKDAMEDIKGFYFTNDIAQKAYDVLNWYDRNPLRRNLKAVKTVFNPAVRLGNRTGNYMFSWLSGINPVSFEKNRQWANGAIKNNDPLYRYAMQRGLTGNDVTKADIIKASVDLSREIKDPHILRRVIDEIQSSYGRVDDSSKLAAFKTWVDRGIAPEEAVNRVRRGYQDYNMVGMFYDLGAKFPILGNPFIRFASESIRIAKNSAVDRPIRAVGTVAAISLFGQLMSRISGESPEDKATREARVGASHLPFTNISTNIQTPYGEVNVSRLLGFSTTFTPEDANMVDFFRYAPIQNPLDKRNYGSDPLIGPVISMGMDADFRGKSIADPNQSKWKPTTLTKGEQNLNKASYAARSYLPPTATDIYNLGAAVKGEPNVYGQEKTPLQAGLRIYPGVKAEQYGPEEADRDRLRLAHFEELKLESIKKKVTSIQKQLDMGEISQDQANKRTQELWKEMLSKKEYEKSKDSPQGTLPRLDLYKNAFMTSPLDTIHALRTGQPIRKLNGDAIVVERQKGLSKLDFGNKETQIDHITANTLGGDNSISNLQILSASDNRAKGVVATRAQKLLKEGKITKTEAREMESNWKDEATKLPTSEKNKIETGKGLTKTDKANIDGTEVSESTSKETYKEQVLKELKGVKTTSTKTTTTSGKDVDSLIKKYFPQSEWDTARAVMMAESGGNSNAKGDDYPIGGLHAPSYGLFQIRALQGRPGADKLLDPEENIKYAAQMQRSEGWGPWSAYTNGNYQQYLGGKGTFNAELMKNTKSELTKKQNAIESLLTEGKLTLSEATKEWEKLESMKTKVASKIKVSKPKKAKKIGTIKIAKTSIPKITNFKLKMSKPAKVRLAKNTFKVSKSKQSKPAKYKIAKTKSKFSKKFTISA